MWYTLLLMSTSLGISSRQTHTELALQVVCANRWFVDAPCKGLLLIDRVIASTETVDASASTSGIGGKTLRAPLLGPASSPSCAPPPLLPSCVPPPPPPSAYAACAYP